MAVHIRLRRIGKNPKKSPHFRLSVFSQERGRDSTFIEEIGYYMPTTGVAKIKKERYEYWLKKGAVPSDTVKSLLKKAAK